MMKKLLLVIAAIGLAPSGTGLAQDEETVRDRAKLSVICGPALDMTLSRFDEPGLYREQKASPRIHDGTLSILKLAQMGMTNYKLFSSFAVAKEVGRPSSEIADEFKAAEVKARADFSRFPAGELPVQFQPVIEACVKSIFRHDKAMEDATKASLLEFLDTNLPLYFSKTQ